MKTIKLFSLTALCLAFGAASFSQSKTESFAVSGNCGMCKSNIEKAAKKGGAKTATWNKESKELTVTYISSSTNTAKIQEEIAKAGYDNAGFRAKDEDYKKLHACCQYDRADSDKASTKEMDCCKKDGEKMDCCKDGKCTKTGHDGKDCCKKSE